MKRCRRDRINKIVATMACFALVVGLLPAPAFADVDVSETPGQPASEAAPAVAEKPSVQDPVGANSSSPAGVAQAPVFPAFAQSATVDGVTVTVEADAGAFPEGARLSVASAPSSATEAAVAPERDAGANVAASYTFDVKVLDADGAELQPAGTSPVRVSFRAAEVADPNLDVSVYHVSGGTADELAVSESGSTATARSDGFSYYTVEFTYGELQYVLQGGEKVPLADVLAAVGLVGEVADVEVSDPALFSASKETGGWVVTSHRAFSSEEWMRVTIGGRSYEIAVTDDQKCGDNLTWTLSNGVLTISGTGAMSNYETSDSVPWHGSASSITSVVIGDGVMSIGKKAFYDCIALASVTIPSSVTDIGSNAFKGCTALSTIAYGGSQSQWGNVAKEEAWDADTPLDVTYAKLDVIASANPEAGGRVEGAGAYEFGTETTLKAVEHEGYHFVKWTVDDKEVSDKADYDFIVNESRTLVAHFELDNYTISAKVNDEKGGTVTGGGTFKYGATTTLKAEPKDGYAFDCWTRNGDDAWKSHDLELEVTVEGDRTYTAYFREVLLGTIGEQQYTGDPITPTGFTVQLIGVDAKLTEGTDYSLSYAYDLPASKGTVIATFVGDFKGKASEGFKIKKQPLTVTAKSAKRAYNGEALTCPGYDPEGLVGKNEISSVQVAGSQTDAGESASTVESVKVVSASGEDADVTGYYDITLVPGKLEVAPKAVTITAKSEEFTYDGAAHANAGYDVEGLVGSDAISATVTGSITFPNQSPVANEVERYEFKTGAAGNYTVTTVDGKLTMKNASRKITITAASVSKAYDGTVLTAPGVSVTEGELFAGDALVAEATGSVTDVADTRAGNNLVKAGYKVMHGGVDVTDNYAITPVAGTLEVTPAKATIAVDSASKVEGEADPAFTGTVEGLVKAGDLGEVAYRRTNADEAPGTYKGAIAATYTANPNYDVAVRNGDFTITAKEKGSYEPASGSGSTWAKGSADALTFTFKRAADDGTTFDRFKGVEVDGKAVPEKDASGKANWTAERGSLVLSLQPSYLETLADGDHTVKALFDDGAGEATFKVTAAKAAPAESKTTKADKTTPAKTGDTLPVPPVVTTLLLSAAALLVSRKRLTE